MKKKLKAFTLIELIVAIAVFGILMAGIVRMIEPLSTTASSSAVLNNQRNVENAIVTYLGENLRYASNLVIIKGGTPDDAVQKFIDLAPSDYSGKQIDYTVAANKDKIRVIAFDCKNGFTYKNNQFNGRLISTVEGRSGSLDFDYSNLSSDGTKNQYLVFGDEYYAQGDYFLDARICNGNLCLTVCSDYFYNPSKASRFSRTGGDTKDDILSRAPTRGTYELRCMTDDSKAFVFACIGSDSSLAKNDPTKNDFDPSQPATVTRADRDIIYFVYTYATHDKNNDDYVTNNGLDGKGTPNGPSNCTSLDGSSGSSGGSSSKPSGGNNNKPSGGNSGSSSGSSSGGNSGGNSGGSTSGGSTGGITGGNTSGGNTGGNTGDSGNSGGNSGGSTGGSSTPADLGNISVDNIVTGDGEKGVRSAKQNADGSVSLVIGNDAWNTVGMKITTNDDGTVTYTMTFTGEGNKYILDSTIFPALYANNSYTLNEAQRNWLSNNYGIHFK